MTVARHLLLVETRAHRPFGHFPVVFADLAVELMELGCRIDVLTESGWALERDPAYPPLAIHEFDPKVRRAVRRARHLHRVPPRWLGRRLVEIAESAVTIRAAGRLRDRLGCAGVIVITQLDPMVGSMVATRGSWLFYEYGPPGVSIRHRVADPGPMAAPWGPTTHALARVWNRPPRAGRTVRVAASDRATQEAWAAVAPELDPVLIPFISARRRDPVPDARSRLGLPANQRLVLFFGGDHPSKDSDTVWAAARRSTGWRLVLAGGGGADDFRDWSARNGVDPAGVSLFDGFLPDGDRARLFAACDVVVLSYRPDKTSDSGNLVDAIGWGKTVVCSDGCPAADVVRQYGLGRVFEPGNVDALLAALRDAPSQPDVEGLARARDEYDASAVAGRNLDALFG